jgi:hypothetical protein
MDQRGKTPDRQKKNPGGGEIFRRRPDRPWGPPSLLYYGYRVSFPGVKRPGRTVDHPPSSSARVKERVELYLYSPSGPSWPVIGRPLPFSPYHRYPESVQTNPHFESCFLNTGMYITIKHNKLLIISATNAICSGPYGPSSGFKIHYLKHK